MCEDVKLKTVSISLMSRRVKKEFLRGKDINEKAGELVGQILQ